MRNFPLLLLLLFTLPSCEQHRIYIHPYAYWYDGDTAFAEFTELDRANTLDRLFDEQQLVPLNTDIPRSAPEVRYDLQKYFPLRGVVDLGGPYALTDIYYYDGQGVDSFYLYVGYPDRWQLILATTTSYDRQWVHLKLHVRTRYVYIVLKGRQSVVKEMLFYGDPIAGAHYLAPKRQHPLPERFPTIGEEMGVVIFNDFPYPPIYPLGKWLRAYENMPWIDTAVYEHDINRLHFAFDRYSNWGDYISYYFPDTLTIQHFKFPEDGLDSSAIYFAQHHQQKFIAIQGSLPINNWSDLPVDHIAHPQADLASPASYDRVARMAYLLGVVVGKGHAPDRYHQIQYPARLHQGTYAYVEDGNERDASWVPASQFLQVDQYFAYASMFDDGNGAPQASELGLKNADPELKHVMFGTVEMDSTFLKALHYYMYYRRPDHRFFIDVYNFHHYSFIPNAHAISPEDDSLRKKITRYVQFIHNLDPHAQVWYTEWGYDRNRNSDLAVPVLPGVDSATLQAWWIIRAELAIAFTGVTANTLFQLRNDGQEKDYDSSGIHRFNTTGLLDDYDDKSKSIHNFSAYPAYYYFVSFYQLMKNYRADTIIRETPGDSVWIYRFKNVLHPDSVIYAIWCPTTEHKIISKFAFYLKPHAQLETVRLQDKLFIGERNDMQADDQGRVWLRITENPLFVLTKINLPGKQH